MPTIKNPLFKKIIHDTITMTEDFDVQGKAVPRSSFPKKSIGAVRSIMKKIEGDFVVAVEKDGVQSVVKMSEYTEEHGKKVSQMYGSEELELDDSELKVFRDFYKERKEVPSILLSFPDADLEAFEVLTGDKKNISE